MPIMKMPFSNFSHLRRVKRNNSVRERNSRYQSNTLNIGHKINYEIGGVTHSVLIPPAELENTFNNSLVKIKTQSSF